MLGDRDGRFSVSCCGRVLASAGPCSRSLNRRQFQGPGPAEPSNLAGRPITALRPCLSAAAARREETRRLLFCEAAGGGIACRAARLGHSSVQGERRGPPIGWRPPGACCGRYWLTTLLPAGPSRMSTPRPPLSASSPAPPSSVSAPAPPVSTSLPSPPSASSWIASAASLEPSTTSSPVDCVDLQLVLRCLGVGDVHPGRQPGLRSRCRRCPPR